MSFPTFCCWWEGNINGHSFCRHLRASAVLRLHARDVFNLDSSRSDSPFFLLGWGKSLLDSMSCALWRKMTNVREKAVKFRGSSILHCFVVFLPPASDATVNSHWCERCQIFHRGFPPPLLNCHRCVRRARRRRRRRRQRRQRRRFFFAPPSSLFTLRSCVRARVRECVRGAAGGMFWLSGGEKRRRISAKAIWRRRCSQSFFSLVSGRKLPGLAWPLVLGHCNLATVVLGAVNEQSGAKLWPLKTWRKRKK